MTKKNVELVDITLQDDRMKTFMLLLQTVDAVNKYSDACFFKLGLSQIKFVVLQVLEINGGTMKPTDIARWTFREKHNITTLIRRLERDGLVTIEDSPTDRRSINVTLTKKGKQALKQARPMANEIMEQVMSSVNEANAADLGKNIMVLRKNTLSGFEKLNI